MKQPTGSWLKRDCFSYRAMWSIYNSSQLNPTSIKMFKSGQTRPIQLDSFESSWKEWSKRSIQFSIEPDQVQWSEFLTLSLPLTLVVPAGNYYTVAQELEHVCSWAEENNLKLNKSKSKEIVIYRNNVKNLTIKLPLPHENITRVKNLKIWWSSLMRGWILICMLKREFVLLQQILPHQNIEKQGPILSINLGCHTG